MGVDKFTSIAVIGAGYMANEHIKAFNSIPQVQVTGLYSRSHERATQLANQYQIAFIAKSIKELYEKTQAHLVVVAVTETALPLIMQEILQYPWAILFEKPVGLSLQQAEAFYNQVENAQAKAIVALNRRFYSSSCAVLKELENADGKRYIQINDYQSLQQAKDLQYPPEVQAGLMFANSIHLIDYFKFLGRGSIENINVVQHWEPHSNKPVIAHLTYNSGDEGLYQGIWHGPGPWAISVVTNTHYFELKPLETATFRTQQERKLQSLPISEEDRDYKPGLRQQAMQAVRFAHNLDNNSVTLKDSLQTMKLIHQIYN